MLLHGLQLYHRLAAQVLLPRVLQEVEQLELSIAVLMKVGSLSIIDLFLWEVPALIHVQLVWKQQYLQIFQFVSQPLIRL